MVNQFFKNISLAAALISFVACDGKLDIVPTQSIDQNNALNTEQDVKITLVGAYDGLTDNDVYAGGFEYFNDLMGDDREVLFGGTFSTIDEIWRKTLTTTNSQITTTWLNAYDAINRANNVLGALDKVGTSSRGQVEGEARFIRGLLYFGLVKHFGKTWGDGDNSVNLGVPLVTTPTRSITDADYKSRSTVAQVYAQIIEDLTTAEKLLPEQTEPGDIGLASRNAATAMLSRIYMIQGEYAKARDAANKVISSGIHELSGTFADVFDDQSSGHQSEVLFHCVVTDQDGSNSMNTYYASSQNQGRGDIRIQQKHLTLYEAADVRGKFFNKSGSNTFTSKHNDRYGDVIVIRLAELYLNRAECNFRLSTNVGATPLEDVNVIRQRAGLADLTTVNIDAILKERKLELAFEGGQLDDLKRTKRSVGTLTYNDNKLVMPIPQREIDTNKKLVQNTGY